MRMRETKAAVNCRSRARMIVWAAAGLLLLCAVGGLVLCILIHAYDEAPRGTWNAVFNDCPDGVVTGEYPYAGAPRARKLNALELRLVTPDAKADWMRYKDGFAVYDDEGVLFVTFKVTTQTPGMDIHISVGRVPYYGGYAGSGYTKTNTPSVIGELSYMLAQTGCWIDGYACADGIYYGFQVQRILEQEASVKADLKTVLACIAVYEPGVPQLRWIKPGGKPSYFAYWEYSQWQSRNDDTYGQYIPSEGPARLDKFSGTRLKGLYMADQLNVCWAGSDGRRLWWSVGDYEPYILRWNGPEKTVRTTEDIPVPDARMLSVDDLYALVKQNNGVYSIALDVRFGNVQVSIEWSGLDPETDIDWLYRQLRRILWR